MKLAVGDLVVYGPHGAGRVSARERRVVLGESHEVIELAFAGGLSIQLPLERAQELLRPIADESDLSRVRDTLRMDQPVSKDSWLARRRDVLAKLTVGSPVGLAEIIRDGACRERGLSGSRGGSQLSPGERELFGKARRLLSTEIGLARDIEPQAADDWIGSQLVRAERARV